MRFDYLSFTGVCLALLSYGSVAQAAPTIAGQVMLASGSIMAQSPEQANRPLKRGSDFYPADTLTTGSESEAQLRFNGWYFSGIATQYRI